MVLILKPQSSKLLGSQAELPFSALFCLGVSVLFFWGRLSCTPKLTKIMNLPAPCLSLAPEYWCYKHVPTQLLDAGGWTQSFLWANQTPCQLSSIPALSLHILKVFWFYHLEYFLCLLEKVVRGRGMSKEKRVHELWSSSINNTLNNGKICVSF